MSRGPAWTMLTTSVKERSGRVDMAPLSADDRTQLPRLVAGLYATVQELESVFPGRHFTLDGHLVGSLAEVVAAHVYGLELLPSSTPCHDARCTGTGQNVQVKGTQRKRIALYDEPDHLIVLQIGPRGVREVYNGPGAPVWSAAGAMAKNGQRGISVPRLLSLASEVPIEKRIAAIRPMDTW